jgi:hypothetical protein
VSDAPGPGASGLGASARDDPRALLEALVDGVGRALPAGVARQTLEVERTRTLGDRLAGRPGAVSLVRIRRDDESMTLRLERDGTLLGEVARIVRGIVISRRTLSLGDWLSLFAGEVGAIAADAAGDAANAARALSALGVRPVGSDVVVEEADVARGLVALPPRIRGRVPADAVDRVTRIAALLGETLPRVEGSGEPEILVRRTATVYLPYTLRAYLALPADWAESHVLSNGMTAAEALLAQLDALELAARRMRDASVEQDATGLLVNGRFLADRFAASSLDLPPAGPPAPPAAAAPPAPA